MGINGVEYILFVRFAGMAELADAHGLGPCGSNTMRVQVSFPALERKVPGLLKKLCFQQIRIFLLQSFRFSSNQITGKRRFPDGFWEFLFPGKENCSRAVRSQTTVDAAAQKGSGGQGKMLWEEKSWKIFAFMGRMCIIMK